MDKQAEEVSPNDKWTLTLKGVVYMALLETPSNLSIEACSQVAQQAADRIGLHMRRHHSSMVVAMDADPDSVPALVLDDGKFVFTAAHKDNS